MVSGKVILWKWYFVDQMKGAQELLKNWEASDGFRSNGWLIGIRVWSSWVSRLPFRVRQNISSNKWVCGDIEIKMNYLEELVGSSCDLVTVSRVMNIITAVVGGQMDICLLELNSDQENWAFLVHQEYLKPGKQMRLPGRRCRCRTDDENRTDL